MNKILKNALILTLITLVSGLLLGLVFEITKEPIAASKEKAKQEAYKKVLPEADSFGEVVFEETEAAKILEDASISGCSVNEVAGGKTKDGETMGYVVTTTSGEGYGGDIKISVGISGDGTVQGVEILTIGETAGLGMKATEPEFRQQFAGKQVEAFEVTKTGASSDEQINALSGATITSKAFTNAVNASLAYYNNVLGGSANE